MVLALNPNYRQAHIRLAYLLKRHLNDPDGAREHFRLFREVRSAGADTREPSARHSENETKAPLEQDSAAEARDLPPLEDEVVVVSGLPRSGTSMLMQMLVAGGLSAVTDGVRQADEDNPRGYFEYEPVKQMRGDAKWLKDAKRKVVKIVAPLIPDVPLDVALRVIFIDRDLEEILASQAVMLSRRREQVAESPGRRERLKDQYANSVLRVKSYLSHRPRTHLLSVDRKLFLSDPKAAAAAINRFLGGHLDELRMVSAVNPQLYRQRVDT